MNKFSIDAKTQILISLLVGGVSFFGSNALPGSIPPDVQKTIHDWCVLLTQFYTVVVGPLLLAYTNSNPGPLAPPDPPKVLEAKAKEDAKS